ncbi:hypothetical protein [Halalkalibacter nanhaiisediminis]|uniref:Uncharacterized protein n=1 Tax=Halalkalibacter nanhaiisediminis TaxID=688079 RepID=A0A562QSI0_9BACI|nr:hypothetical protein [Halalkalibacter nanhaiisediminis]TWI59694.1 hypothetical protein IQ10_00114 [Halalkalibacter nanhaiisediminis]
MNNYVVLVVDDEKEIRDAIMDQYVKVEIDKDDRRNRDGFETT